ncbi:MAG: hypothetical protein DRH11_18560, partial [Deltaproteobacteria bacterium]
MALAANERKRAGSVRGHAEKHSDVGVTMVSQSVQKKYCRVLMEYVADPDEKHLVSAADLGRELVLARIPLEEIVEMHEQALSF